MNTETIKSILDIHESNLHWVQDGILHHNGVNIQIWSLVGEKCQPIPYRDKLDQPTIYPLNCSYRFNPSEYHGEESLDKMKQTMKSMCPGCSLYQHTHYQTKVGTVYTFRCSHYNVGNEVKTNKGEFTKTGVKRASIKRSNRKSSWKRTTNPKLKHSRKRGGKGAIKTNRDGTSIAAATIGKKRAKTADRRGKVAIVSTQKAAESLKKRTLSDTAQSQEKRCNQHIKVLMVNSGEWFFKSDSILQHSYHGRVDTNATACNENDLTDDDMDLLNIMYNSSVSNQIIANIMTQRLNKRGVKGEFLTSTIKNISNKTQSIIDALDGISSDMTEAEKAIAELNR